MADVKIRVVGEDAASKELGKVNKSLEEMKGAAGKAGESGKGMGVDWEMALIGINQGIQIARQAIELLKQSIEFVREGAAIERLMETSSNLAESMGGDMDAIISAVNQATLGTVSDFDIMQASARAMMLGISADADDMALLWEVAAFRARALGQTTEEAFTRITNAIASGHTMTLRNQGIMLDAKDAYDKYAESVGKSADELTEAEKMQARMNAVIEDTLPLLEEQGGLVGDSATEWERLDAGIKNLSNSIKGDFANTALPLIKTLADELTVINANRAIEEMEQQLLNLGYTAEDIKGLWQGKTFFLFDEEGAAEAALEYLRILQGELGAAGEAAEFARRMTDPYSESQEYAAEAASRLAVDTEEVAEAIDEHERAMQRAAIRAIEYSGASDIARKALEELGVEAEEQKRLLDDLAEATENKTAADLLLEEVNLRLTELWVDEAIGKERYNAALETATRLANEYPEALSPLIELFGEWGGQVQNISDLLSGLPSEIRIDVIQTWYEAQGGTWTGPGGHYVDETRVRDAAGGEIHAAAGLPVHWVGEMGPEPFIPAVSGRIVSNTQAVQALREGGGGPPIVNVTINTPFNFADTAWVERELEPYISRGVREALR